MKISIALFVFMTLTSSAFAVCKDPAAKAVAAVVMLEELNGEKNPTVTFCQQTSITNFRNLTVKTGGMYASEYAVEVADSDDCRVMSIRFMGGQE